MEKILRVKGKKRKQFLVKWRGWAKSTWEPLRLIEDTVAYDNFLKSTTLNGTSGSTSDI